MSLDVPEAPKQLSVTDIERHGATLSWLPPANDGGSPVLGYLIEYCLTDGFRWERANDEPVSACKFKITGLKENMSYKFRVAAVNLAGNGLFAESKTSVEIAEPIGKFKRFILENY